MNFSNQFRTDYPKLTRRLYEISFRVPTKPKVWAAFLKYSELSSTEARKVFQTCSLKPTVDYRLMPGNNGEFSGGTAPDTVFLAKSICDKFEGSATDAADPRMELLLESTLLHELVHWGDWKDGKDQDGEEGKKFEKEAYGADVDRYW